MRWLLWKEYRLNRPVAVFLMLLLGTPYVVTLSVFCFLRFVGKWEEVLFGSAMYSLVLSQLAIATLGGHIIAGERTDRSVEFQVYLPLTRYKILVGKLLFAFVAIATPWLVNSWIFWAIGQKMTFGPPPELLSQIVCNIAITGLTFFCVAWLFSSFLTSSTYSAAAGLAAPLVIVGVIIGIAKHLGVPADHVFTKILEPWYCGICLTLAPLCLAGGCWLYVRRVEP